MSSADTQQQVVQVNVSEVKRTERERVKDVNSDTTSILILSDDV